MTKLTLQGSLLCASPRNDFSVDDKDRSYRDLASLAGAIRFLESLPHIPVLIDARDLRVNEVHISSGKKEFLGLIERPTAASLLDRSVARHDHRGRGEGRHGFFGANPFSCIRRGLTNAALPKSQASASTSFGLRFASAFPSPPSIIMAQWGTWHSRLKRRWHKPSVVITTRSRQSQPMAGVDGGQCSQAGRRRK